MAKTHDSRKQSKKPALLTPKEKKAKRFAKKHAADAVPLIATAGLAQRAR
jgi:hypothetical protein